MNERTKQLAQLREQAAKKAQLESACNALHWQKRELLNKIDCLQREMEREQQDVERLEGKNLSALFHNLLGKREQRLDKERKEAYAARRNYEAARQELEVVEYNLRSNGNALAAAAACEMDYELLLNELMMEVQTSDTSELEMMNKALAEAKEEQSRTEEAMRQIETVRSHLQEALGWVSTVSVENNEADRKRDKALLDARWGLNDLQKQIQLLKTEVKIYPTMISGVGSDTLPGKAIIQMIKNAFGHLNHTEAALREYLTQTNSMCQKLETERDYMLINLLDRN